jgi:hypothetical protein
MYLMALLQQAVGRGGLASNCKAGVHVGMWRLPADVCASAMAMGVLFLYGIHSWY